MEPMKQQVWTWVVEHREWVFSGIGTAIVMGVAGYLLAQTGVSKQDKETAQKTKEPAVSRPDTRKEKGATTIQITTGDQSPAISDVKGNIEIQFDTPEKK